MAVTLDFRSSTGLHLQEHQEQNVCFFTLDTPSETLRFSVHPQQAPVVPDFTYPHPLQELLDSGRDLLAEELLARGEPDYASVAGLLPPLTEGAYCFLSGAISWSGVTVDRMGQILPQENGGEKPELIFRPEMLYGDLKEIQPRQFLIEGKYPILINRFRLEDTTRELMYFVEPGDPDRDPIVWIRSKCDTDPLTPETSCHMVSRSRNQLLPVEDSTLLEALSDTLLFWHRFHSRGAVYHLPEPVPARVAEGAMMSLATTFSGDHPHYGHKFYGRELHDHFPPNLIWSLEAAILNGHALWAKRIWQNFLIYSLTADGRIVYRQGAKELISASAEEYGHILLLLKRYRGILKTDLADPEIRDKLLGMGQVLQRACSACPEDGGRTLVRMCAEADTNGRIHAYLNNNLWAIRGLESLAELLTGEGYPESAPAFRDTATLLRREVFAAALEAGEDTPYGKLLPFRFGYDTLPLTLSSCTQVGVPVDPAYFQESDMRGSGSDRQDYTENTYANYRYYPEILSSMLLPPELAATIQKLRENRGGEILGMTRLYERLDDWPVAHYARYLLETGQKHKYQMLLYAHTAHSGHPELMCYYEQVGIDGRVWAPDCVPSLLTVPLMTGWMFAYQKIEDDSLLLLAGVPDSWFRKGFRAERVGYSGGNCQLESNGENISIRFSDPLTLPAQLHTPTGIHNLPLGITEYTISL